MTNALPISAPRRRTRWALPLLAVALAACAHTDPFERQARAEELREAAADPARICNVRVENATEFSMDAGYRSGGTRMRLGVLEAGEGIEFGVPCVNRYVVAYGRSTVFRAGDTRRSRAQTAELDLLDVTYVRLR